MPTGNITDPLSLNYYVYSANNPVLYCDPSGNAWETVLDVASLIESTASLAADPSIQNALFFAWDAASVALPFIPGSYLAKGVKWLGKTDEIVSAGKALNSAEEIVDGIHDTQNVIKNGIEVSQRLTPKLGDKVSFIFGKAKGDIHNVSRSKSMLGELEKIGIIDNDENRELITEKIIDSYYNGYRSAELYNRESTEFFVMGSYGGVKIKCIWENDALITVYVYGGKN